MARDSPARTICVAAGCSPRRSTRDRGAPAPATRRTTIPARSRRFPRCVRWRTRGDDRAHLAAYPIGIPAQPRRGEPDGEPAGGGQLGVSTKVAVALLPTSLELPAIQLDRRL